MLVLRRERDTWRRLYWPERPFRDRDGLPAAEACAPLGITKWGARVVRVPMHKQSLMESLALGLGESGEQRAVSAAQGAMEASRDARTLPRGESAAWNARRQPHGPVSTVAPVSVDVPVFSRSRRPSSRLAAAVHLPRPAPERPGARGPAPAGEQRSCWPAERLQQGRRGTLKVPEGGGRRSNGAAWFRGLQVAPPPLGRADSVMDGRFRVPKGPFACFSPPPSGAGQCRDFARAWQLRSAPAGRDVCRGGGG